MKIKYTEIGNSVSIFMLSVLFVLVTVSPENVFAVTSPDLGAAGAFSVIGQTAITGSGQIDENVGINSTGAGITAITAGDVGGTIYSIDGVAPSTDILNPDVQADLSTANDDILSRAATSGIGPVLDGLSLTAGTYDVGAGRLNGGVLTLDGPGVYIFRASSDFISSGSIELTNGANACDIYWQINTLATINGSSFTGTIIAGTGIHFGSNVSLDGKALALGGDVTLLNNTIVEPTCTVASVEETPGEEDPIDETPDEETPVDDTPDEDTPEKETETTEYIETDVSDTATLIVVKKVINNNGGTSVASDFTITVTDQDVSKSSFVGSENGTEVTIRAGSYFVREIKPVGYTQSFSSGCIGKIEAGEYRTCTIVNNDNSPDPKLPNAGLPPTENNTPPWNIIVSVGLLVIMVSVYFSLKQQKI